MLGYQQQIIAKSFGCLDQQKVAEDGWSWHVDHSIGVCRVSLWGTHGFQIWT